MKMGEGMILGFFLIQPILKHCGSNKCDNVDFLGVFWLRKGLLILTWRCSSHPHILLELQALEEYPKVYIQI